VDGFAKLERLIANLETLASDGADDASAAAASAVEKVVEAEYTEGKGPDGKRWADKADGTASHLQKTGAMRSATQVVPGVKGVSVRIPKPGGFHQGGTSRMPARPLVPEGEPLPPSWEQPVAAAVKDAFAKALK
jgi:hypothetical protein